MNITTVLRCALAGGVLVSLAGCGGGSSMSRTFGLNRDSPDEFTVTTRAPLSMPPDFTLRPPQPGAARPQEQSTTQTAQLTVAGSDALATTGPSDSPGQDALLAAAGTLPPSNIRQTVDAEAAAAANNRSLGDELMFWRTPAPPGTVVDASKEAERLRDNAALGKAPDTGDTPVIKKKDKGIFEDLF